MIKNKHSKPEVIIRSLLHRKGIRFRINANKLPGNPDIVISKYQTIILVHGCFWHRHENCKKATFPKTNEIYWHDKFRKNKERDKYVKKSLEKLNWKIIVLWECDILRNPCEVINKVLKVLDVPNGYCYDDDISKVKIIKVAEKRSKYLMANEK